MNYRQATMNEWETIYNISKKNSKLLGPVLLLQGASLF